MKLFVTRRPGVTVTPFSLRRHLKNALLLIAAYAINTGATAQIAINNVLLGSAPVSAVVQTEQVRAELIAHAPQGAGPGQAVWLGLKIEHQPHWHTYWKNPGDSGLPTTLDWTLPAGVTAGATAWPAPKSIAIGRLTNYGYEDTVVLPVPLTISQSFQPTVTGDLEVKLTASWLVCRQECIPQDGNFVLRIPVRSSTALNGAAFEAAQAAAPLPHGGNATARIEKAVMTVTVQGLPASWQGKALQAFPEFHTVFETTGTPALGTLKPTLQAAEGSQAWEGGTWTGRFTISDQRTTDGQDPAEMAMVLRDGPQTLRVLAPITGTWPPVAPPGDISTGSPGSDAATNSSMSLPAAASGGGNWMALALAMGAALLGGLILNLMPCVLPVLAIKVMAVAQHANQTQRVQRLQGLAYTAGVIGSFLALGALMLALRAGGEQLGWGFHLQSPAVVAGLALLFTLLALNLAGVFEIGNVLPQGLANLQAKHPAADAFLSGMLAVAIASPCSAPFMGASLGYAITLPAIEALAIFAALGLGLALPFLAAAWVPAVAQWLPRPGAWMDTLRRFMAFPMFATVVWLVWVLGHLSGVDGAGALLALLVVIAWVVWSFTLTGRSRMIFATLSIAACALFAGVLGPFVLKMEANDSAVSSPVTSAPGTWQAWAPGRVEAELAAGKPVFVDFTAAWCITCQYNKKTTLANTEVLADFNAKGVTLLRADWTRRDPAITKALEQLGRSGVPVYVLYQAGRAPVVFSEILDAADLRAAVGRI